MDFIRARVDKISVPFSRPQPTDTFVHVSYIDLYIDDDYVLEYPKTQPYFYELDI